MGELKMEGLNHIGVIVRDIEVSKKFYTGVLDCKVENDRVIEKEDGDVKISFVSNGNLCIELIQEAGEYTCTPDGIVAHIAFNCRDIDSCFEELKSRGAEMITPEIVDLPHFFDRGCRYFLFKGPDGETLELNEIL